jgi:DNA-binding transcriptional LysR family regulator
MDVRQLRLFATVVQPGNPSRAADMMMISPPEPARTIKCLEDRLGSMASEVP